MPDMNAIPETMRRLGFQVEDTGGGCLCYALPEGQGLSVTLGRSDGEGLPTSMSDEVSATIRDGGEERDESWPSLRVALSEMFPDEMGAS